MSTYSAAMSDATAANGPVPSAAMALATTSASPDPFGSLSNHAVLSCFLLL